MGHTKNYISVFPKTAPCSKMIVIDVEKDKSYYTWECKEALMAATAIQGLVNRTSAEKIYFINYPNEHFWNPVPTDLQQLETHGFFPVQYEYAQLPENKKYPALSYLVARYESYIKGKVLYPQLSEEICDGSVMAAITVCGQTDSIPVSPAIDSYIAEEGYSFELVEDTTVFSNNIEAFDWALANYFTERTTRAFIGQHSYTAFGGKEEDQFPILYDYFIAHRAFVFCLNGNIEEERTKLKEILTPGRYPPATPVIGLPVDEGEGIKSVEENGYYFVIANMQNTSCTCAFETDPGKLHPQPEPCAVDVEEDGVYVAFYVTDGDSMGFATVFHYDDMRNKPYAGQVPVGLSINPLLLDLHPCFMEDTWKYAPDYYEVICDWNDQNYGTIKRSSPEAWKTYYTIMQNNIGQMGIYTVNDFDTTDLEFALKVNPYYLIRGYQGGFNNTSDMKIVGETVVSLIIGKTQEKDIDDIVDNIRTAVSNTAKGEPVFILVAAGNGRSGKGCDNFFGGDITVRIKAVMDRLAAKPEGRKYTFLKPKDLAATWRKWKGI